MKKQTKKSEVKKQDVVQVATEPVDEREQRNLWLKIAV